MKNPMKVFNRLLWTVCTSIFFVLFLVLFIAVYFILPQFDAAINMAFGTSRTETVGASDFADFETDYDFEINGDNLYKEDAKMIEEAEGAGAVLLWNKNNALPLKDTEKKVSTFGHASANIVECGSGSGYAPTFNYLKDEYATTTFKMALESRGFTVNPAMWNFYVSGAGSDEKYKMTDPWGKCRQWSQWYVAEVPWSVLGRTETNSFASYNDVAFITFARSGGEHSDLHYNYANSDDTVGNNAKPKGTQIEYTYGYEDSKKSQRGVENTAEDGGYLGLTDEEESILQNVCALRRSNAFKKVVLLLNTGNTFQMRDLIPYLDDVDACMWIGQPGSTGINAVVDLLKGKDLQGNTLTPSGHLTDTWAYDLNSAPASVNDGNYTYGNTNYMSSANWSKSYANGFGTNSNHNKYMVYQEGIYVGYRYYETRYSDAVAPVAGLTANASSSAGAKNDTLWNYDKEVAFPFGYGLSYTTFAYSDFNVVKQGEEYVATGTVKNTGSVAGREVVEIYLQKPYTQYDKTNKVEKSAIELVGYDKTTVLQPNGTYRFSISVPAEYCKTYDANNKKTYIVEEGDYYFTVGTDAHVALNNILQYTGKVSSPTQSVMVNGGKPAALGSQFVKSFHLNNDYVKYSKATQTGYPITNQLDSGDLNKYANKGTNATTYLSRSDWSATYPTKQTLTLNQAMANDLVFANYVGDDSEYVKPDYQLVNGSETNAYKYNGGNSTENVYVADVEEGDVVACQFENAPVDPAKAAAEHQDEEIDGMSYEDYWTEMWDMLLDEMSLNEQMYIAVNSYHAIQGAPSIALPETKQENGPVGITKRQEALFALPNDASIKGSNNNGTGWIWVAYPCAGILGASFDGDVARRVGEHKSEDMLYLGYNGIYGPGVNLHRSPFSGRSFEYPSEDPFLAGRCESFEAIGIENKGCMAYAKHYALNDQETNRVNIGIWSNEQASRELYLRPFEMVFTEGKASATMNAFSRIGTRWSGGFYNMMTTILRDEWGWDGLVISDWITNNSAMSEIDGIMAGTGTFDGNGSTEKFTKYGVQENAKFLQALRLATKYTIYNVVRTNAMNGFSVDTKVITITPWWETMFKSIDFSLGGVFLVCAGMMTASYVINARTKRAAIAADPVAEEKSPLAQYWTSGDAANRRR